MQSPTTATKIIHTGWRADRQTMVNKYNMLVWENRLGFCCDVNLMNDCNETGDGKGSQQLHYFIVYCPV